VFCAFSIFFISILGAGLLYPSGDYDAATDQIQSLITDKTFAAKVAEGGRSEVERWGWSAATRVLRRKQYGRAIRNKLAHKRFGWLAFRCAVARMLRAPFVLIIWLAARLVQFLDYAHPHRGQLGAV
jgi:hypothetical protein